MKGLSRLFFIILMYFGTMGSIIACDDEGSWVELLSAEHSIIEVDWLSHEDLIEIDEQEIDMAVTLLADSSVLEMDGSEVWRRFPTTASIFKIEKRNRYLLLRRVIDANGSSTSIGFHGNEAYSVAAPLGVCGKLKNSAVLVETAAKILRAYVFCAPTK